MPPSGDTERRPRSSGPVDEGLSRRDGTMARISRYPVFNHLRSEASSHVIRYSNGRAVRSGRGLSLWFRPLNTAIAEIPLDDQDLTFLFHGRSADLQEVVAQGVITYRVTEPDTLAVRVDFGVDIATG